MSKSTSFIIGLLFFVVLNTVMLKAQNNAEAAGSWEIGGFGGISQYYGDISNKSMIQKFSGETKLSYGILARRHFNEFHGIGLSFNRSNVFSAKDVLSTGLPFNLEVDASASVLSLHSYLNFGNYFFGAADRKVTVYGTLGLAYARWNTFLKNSLTGAIVTDLTNAAASNLRTSSAAIPATLGLSFPIGSGFRVNVENTFCTVLSDDIDFYRDAYQYDFLTFTHVGISYTFGNTSKPAARQRDPRVSPQTLRRSEPVSPVTVIDYEVFQELPGERVRVELPPLNIQQAEQRAQPPVQQQVSGGVEFRVQIFAKNNRINNPSQIYRNVQFEFPIVENVFNGLYRYSTGSFRTYGEAEAYAHRLQSRGVHDAFVVAYRGNERISITAAMKQQR